MIHPILRSLAVATLLAGCASLPSEPPPAAAFVMLGAEGTPIARAVTTASTCPAITIDGRTAPMAVRAPYGPIPLRGKDHSATFHADAVSNPVLSCETPLPAGAKQVSVAGQPLPLPPAEVKRIVVIGDTGCRLKGKEFQDCNDPQAYPFARVAASAAAWKPDLVVHVGDFHYREDPCPAGRPGCAGSPYGYGWDAWNADFFAPARTLLAAAPWVIARGNHESCARGGQGWWRFLDAHAYDPAANCDDPAADDRADYTDPYAVPLGAGAQLIVFDSANTNWKGFKPGDPRIARYTDTWHKIDALARRQRYSIAVDHHPLYAFGANQDAQTGAITLFGGDAGLTQVFGALDARLLPPTIGMLLSGHVHLWEQTSFSSDHPTQFVAGFAGTAEDIVPLPKTPPAGQSPAPGAVLDTMSSWIDGFGFMTMERTGADTWRVIVHDRDGKVRNTCTVEGRHSRCAVPQV
ncbi:metallophosphoesterase [Massilia sp. JS1662]|nr:metallophosphoesterase [Massilia sp. JS1662]KGF82882.1 metallophosphoesterase [Massilia sp. JS1662]